MKAVLLVLAWAGLLAAAGGVALHLWLALGLGVGVSLLLGVGLMMLVFHSARRGYDDAARGDAGAQPRRDDAQR